MNITFLGIGSVGSALADQLAKSGHHVSIAARDAGSKSVLAAVARNPSLIVLPPLDAVAGADVVFLATPYPANAVALTPLAEALAG